jgi:hypothetical protein
VRGEGSVVRDSQHGRPERNAEFRGSTRFPYFPASSMVSSCSTCCCCSGASRRCGVAVSALFSVIFNLWRWLTLGVGASVVGTRAPLVMLPFPRT